MTLQTEHAHRRTKRYFARGSKKTGSFIKEATQLDRTREHIARINANLAATGTAGTVRTRRSRIGPRALMDGDLDEHYQIGRTEDNWFDLGEYVRENGQDPAWKVHAPRVPFIR